MASVSHHLTDMHAPMRLFKSAMLLLADMRTAIQHACKAAKTLTLPSFKPLDARCASGCTALCSPSLYCPFVPCKTARGPQRSVANLRGRSSRTGPCVQYCQRTQRTAFYRCWAQTSYCAWHLSMPSAPWLHSIAYSVFSVSIARSPFSAVPPCCPSDAITRS